MLNQYYGYPVYKKYFSNPEKGIGIFVATTAFFALMSGQSIAQPIVPDGTTSTRVLEGNVIVPNDTSSTRGTNLFHSFSEFNVPTSGVTFGVGTTGINGARITNIINRVTGNNPSQIFGTIGSSQDFPAANVYLINPNGLVFGSSSSIDIGRSFVGSTATSIGFSGGGLFNASLASSTLPTGSPINLQFAVTQPAGIFNQGQLAVNTGESLSLIGGTVVSPRTLSAPTGTVDVVAVTGNTTVTLRSPSSILGLEIRAGTFAPQWTGRITELPALAALLTGPTINPEAAQVAVNPDGSLKLLPAGQTTQLSTLFLPSGQFEITGEFTITPGDIILGSISSGDIQARAAQNLGIFASNLQATNSLFLQAANTLILRETINAFTTINVGSNLTFRGDRGIDILALNNAANPITSNANITFTSDGNILADAYFESTGNITARTIANRTRTIFSAIEFQEVQGTIRFLSLQNNPPEVNITNHRQIEQLNRRTTDTVNNSPAPPAPPPPPAEVPLTDLAVQASLSTLNLQTGGSLSTAVDLLLQNGKVLEAQQALDLSIVGELDNYLGNVVVSRASQEILQNLTPEQKQLYETYQTLLIPRTDQTRLDAFLKQPAVKELGRQVSAATLKKLQTDLQKLDPHSAILYPLIRNDRVELILITPGIDPVRRSTFIAKTTLHQNIRDFRYALEAIYDVEADPKKQGQKLYTHLIQPLEDVLEAQNIKTLFYAPYGQFRYVPLTALHDGRQWLAERFRINNITAASLQDFAPKPTPILKILAGAITYNQSISIDDRIFYFPGLPSARREVNYLASLTPFHQTLLNEEFHPAATQERLNAYSVVHLATHAVFLPGKPENSFIVFGKGERQTLADVRKWSLQNVDLLVLSACETASGEVSGNGEEILGFGYVTQERGARATIASLWSISDGGTQAFMDIFYTLLARSSQPISKAEAFRLTQDILITGDFSKLGKLGEDVRQRIQERLPSSVIENLHHPYYWAPFLLIGNGL